MRHGWQALLSAPRLFYKRFLNKNAWSSLRLVSTAQRGSSQQMWHLVQQPPTSLLGHFLGDSGTGALWVCLLLPGKDKDKVRGTTRLWDWGSSQSSYWEWSAVPGPECQEALIQLPLNRGTKQSLSYFFLQDVLHFMHSDPHMKPFLFAIGRTRLWSHKPQAVQAVIIQETLITSPFLLISSWLLQNHEYRWL